MSEKQEVRRENARAFFGLVPGFTDYLGLSVWEYRLYGHYIRVCGDGGECFEFTSTTAQICGMSKSQVKACRAALRELGLVEYEERGEPGSTRVHVTVYDRWELNALFLRRLGEFGRDDLSDIKDWLRWHLANYDRIFYTQPDAVAAVAETVYHQSRWATELEIRASMLDLDPRSYDDPPQPHGDPPRSHDDPPQPYGDPPGSQHDHKERSREVDPPISDPCSSDPCSLDDDGGSRDIPPNSVIEKYSTIHVVARARIGDTSNEVTATKRTIEWLVEDMGPNAWTGARHFVDALDGMGLVRTAAWLWLFDLRKSAKGRYASPEWVEHWNRFYAATDPFAGVESVVGKIITQVRMGNLPDLQPSDWKELEEYIETAL